MNDAERIATQTMRHTLNKAFFITFYGDMIPKGKVDLKERSSDSFFKQYVCHASGMMLELVDGEEFLGAEGEVITLWDDIYYTMNEQDIIEGIVSGKITFNLGTERGKAIHRFIKRFKRIPTVEELDGIAEYMKTFEALE